MLTAARQACALAGLKKMIRLIISIFLFSKIIFAQTDSTEFVTYKWLGKNANANFGIYDLQLKIPKKYKQHHWYYGEGVVTTLLFSDSCQITLHIGFQMKVPLLDEPEFIVEEKCELDEFRIRKGISKKSKLYWEEHNYKGKPINVAFSNVPKEEISIYQKSLKSINIIEH